MDKHINEVRSVPVVGKNIKEEMVHEKAFAKKAKALFWFPDNISRFKTSFTKPKVPKKCPGL